MATAPAIDRRERWSDQDFSIAVPPRCAIYEPKYNRMKFECRPGDRRAEDKLEVERTRADGWPGRWAIGPTYVLGFGLKAVLGCGARTPLEWLNYVETHCMPGTEPKAWDGAGPFGMYSGMSSDGRPRFRMGIKHPVFDPATGKILRTRNGVQKGVDYFDDVDLVPGTEYRFVLVQRFGQDGLLQVMRNGKELMKYVGPYGYQERAPYPCLGIYRNARDTISKAEFSNLSRKVIA